MGAFTDKSYDEQTLILTGEILEGETGSAENKKFHDLIGDSLTDHDRVFFEVLREALSKIDHAQYQVDDCQSRGKWSARDVHRRALDDLYRQLGELLGERILNYYRDAVDREII